MTSKTPLKLRQSDFSHLCETCRFGCCNRVRPPLTPMRKRIIMNFLKTNGNVLANSFRRRQYTFPRETEDGYCIFFDEDTKKCQIHPVKPETCVAGPITFGINPQTERIEWFLKIEKVCPLAGALCRDKESLEKHTESAKSEILRLVDNLDSDSLKAILTIEEPDTVKIGEDILNSKIVEKLRR